MTPFRVLWTLEALSSMAELWVEADDQAAFNTAVRSVDVTLSKAPATAGSELAEGLRRLIEPPILVLYSVDEAHAIVEVADVRPFVR